MAKGVMAKEAARPGAATKVKEHLTLFRLPLDMVIVKVKNCQEGASVAPGSISAPPRVALAGAADPTMNCMEMFIMLSCYSRNVGL